MIRLKRSPPVEAFCFAHIQAGSSAFMWPAALHCKCKTRTFCNTFGVLAPNTGEGTAFKEYRCTDTGSVLTAVALNIKNYGLVLQNRFHGRFLDRCGYDQKEQPRMKLGTYRMLTVCLISAAMAPSLKR